MDARCVVAHGFQFTSCVERIRTDLLKLDSGSSLRLDLHFKGEQKPLNHDVVLILKHHRGGMWSRPMKCTLL